MEMTNPAELQEVLKEAQRYIAALIEGAAACAAHFEQEQDAKGMELLLQIIDGLEWLMSAVRLTRPLQSNPVDPDGAADVFGEIVEGLENQDYTLCGDLLKFELVPMLEAWQEQLDERETYIQ
ncbi:hypothetical protein U6B65_12685 [Oscillospiraceae bacterium MB08-C2-2]|nr:hypothetical protein U6B65_12685 [Oscillospiraceae bacterium MB08-C2-2]